MIIDTKEAWWKAVEENWDDLLGIVSRYHPGASREEQIKANTPDDVDLHITAPGAENACRQIRKEIEKETTGSPVEMLVEARKKRDWRKLYSLFNGAWFGVPESDGAHSIPGFNVLCDLCSECWVFRDEEEEEIEAPVEDYENMMKEHEEALDYVQRHAPKLQIFEHEPGEVIVNLYVLRDLIGDYIAPTRRFDVLKDRDKA